MAPSDSVGPVPLAEAGDEGVFGGKSASLARALVAGLPVPPGVALSVACVEAVVAEAPEAREALNDVVTDLGGSVAVRSSAVGEDDQDTSFAGQHVTLLNVRSEEELVDAIGEVHRSAHSASALAYRKRMEIPGEPRIGVTVQRLVDADSAGVLFTRNPATGVEERLIEASWGLGEAVVSGMIVPDSYRMTPDGTVVERDAGEKDVALRPGGDGGTVEVAVDADEVEAFVLGDRELGMLHDLTVRCEALYGPGLDIEWAFADGELYLLQCRAITS